MYPAKLSTLIILFLFIFYNFCSAQQAIDSLKNSLANTDKSKDRIIIYNDLSWEFLYKNIDSALYFVNKAEKIAEKYGDKQHVATSLQMKALVYEVSGKMEEAATLYIQCIKLNKEIENWNGVASGYNNLGVLFYIRGNNDKALDYFQKSMKYEKQLGNLLGQGECLVNIGSIQLAKNQFNESKKTFLEAYNIFHELENKRLIPRAAINLYTIYRELGDLNYAENYLKESLKLYEETSDYSGMTTANAKMGELQLEKGNTSEALDHFYTAEKQAKSLGKVYELSNLYEILSESWKKMGDYEKALNYKENHMKFSDSIRNTEQSEIIESLEAKFRSADQAKRITELELLKKEVDVQIQKDIVRQLLLGSLLFLFLILIGVFYWRYRTGEKLTNILRQKNIIITKALKEKEILMKEIHHRVKNNLQVISSLLFLQSHFIVDEKANAAVMETKNRVQSMSLLHSSLYTQDNITEIDSKEYLNQLIDNLQKSYYNKNKEIEVRKNIQSLAIDVDIAVPVGLIVNELVTNAYKHAFKNKLNGIILVTFKSGQNGYLLEISDNGVGNNGEALQRDKSMGMILINELCQKLNGDIEFNTQNGVKFTLRFQDKFQKAVA